MVYKRHVDDALGAYILLQVQDHNDKAKDVAEEVGVSLGTIFRIKKEGVQGLKREVVTLFVSKSHNKDVIRCDPYNKLDGPLFEKYVREQFPNFLGKQTRMWYNRGKIVMEQITSGRKKRHFLFVNRASSNTNCHEF